MCARNQIRSIIDSACLAADQSFYHATKMHWWRKIQLWWLPPNVAIPLSSCVFLFLLPLPFFISLFIFPLHYVFLSGLLSLSRGMKAGDLLSARLTEGEDANGCGERKRGRHCCRKNTSTLVHSRQLFTGPAPLHYITQACGRSNGRNPKHRREVQKKSSVCLWFLPPGALQASGEKADMRVATLVILVGGRKTRDWVL